ncbi:hypothetical protein ACWKSP_12765 [Micromonosporaceae bacterium Da 78-11]
MTDAPGRRGDLLAGLVAALLVAAAAIVGGVLAALGRPVHAGAAPLFGHWLPHVGPGTPVALAVAALVVVHGPALAARLSRRTLLGGAYLATVGWTFALALVDGWQRGVAGRLTTKFEYLSEVPGVTDIPALVRGFTGRILDGGPDPWTTHVAGHPPGALLVFVGLDRLGLGGGAWAAILCILVGATVTVSIPVTLHALGATDAARAVVPFLVLFPGAVWVGASADGLFAGVAAAGLALLAVAARPLTGVAAGVVLGGALYLNYGLILLGPLALAVFLLKGRRSVPVPAGAVLGFLAVVTAFTAAGFWWFDGYLLVKQRYYQGLASQRPYLYWVWANLAALTLSAGPVLAPILRRAVVLRRSAVAALPLAAATSILLADLSGLSKAETERIWLPFAGWLLAGAALLPARTRRGWLIVQAGTALLVNHLVLTGW